MIHTIAALIPLAYATLVMLNVPPWVQADHVSVNWNLLSISLLGFMIATLYMIGFPILNKHINPNRAHLTIFIAETIILMGLSSVCLCKALNFFGFL